MEEKKLQWVKKNHSVVRKIHNYQLIVTHIDNKWRKNLFVPYMGVYSFGSRNSLKAAMRDMNKLAKTPRIKAIIKRRGARDTWKKRK